MAADGEKSGGNIVRYTALIKIYPEYGYMANGRMAEAIEKTKQTTFTLNWHWLDEAHNQDEQIEMCRLAGMPSA